MRTAIDKLYGQTGALRTEDQERTLLINRKTGIISMNSMDFKKK